MSESIAAWSDFHRVDIRAGTIVDAKPFAEALKPALRLWIDLGQLGIKKSSAQIVANYEPENLIGKQVICVVNLGSRQVANFMSEVLVTGFPDSYGHIVLSTIDAPVPNGSRLF
jgi:tRNA-binding protein